MKQLGIILVLTAIISIRYNYGLSELYELAQKQLEEEIKEKEHDLLEEAMIKGYKMRSGIGGVTVSIHHPSGLMFIHRNGWTFTCQTEINLDNGHCPGMITESLSMYKPKTSKDYCFFKNFTTINETLCLSQGVVRMTEEKGMVYCTTINGNFPTYITSINQYLSMCRKLSESVTYIYYSDQSHYSHVEVPIEDNPHLKCENFDEVNSTEAATTEANGEDLKNSTASTLEEDGEETRKKDALMKYEYSQVTTTGRYDKHTIKSMRYMKSDKYKFRALWNKENVCLWTEPNKLRIYDKMTS